MRVTLVASILDKVMGNGEVESESSFLQQPNVTTFGNTWVIIFSSLRAHDS